MHLQIHGGAVDQREGSLAGVGNSAKGLFPDPGHIGKQGVRMTPLLAGLWRDIHSGPNYKSQQEWATGCGKGAAVYDPYSKPRANGPSRARSGGQ